MSIQAMSGAIGVRGVTPTEKLLLLVLANYADAAMTCWPSLARIARDSGMSESTIKRTLKALEARGMVSRQARSRDDGTSASNRFTLHFGTEKPAELEGATVNPMGATVNPSGGHGDRGEGATVNPLTTFEPSLEPTEADASVSARKKSTPRPSRRCPVDWSPSPSTIATLEAEGCTSGGLERAMAMMRDHEFSTARSDWDATFRNWVRKDRDRRQPSRQDARYEARQANLARAFLAADGSSRLISDL